MVKSCTHSSIERVKLNLREADHFLPDRQVLRVAGLQAYQFLAGHLQAGWVGIALGVDRLVETLHFGDRITLQGRPIEQLLPTHQQFTELSPPVADMIVTNDSVSEQSPHPLQSIPDAGRPDVPDMHGLSDIR